MAGLVELGWGVASMGNRLDKLENPELEGAIATAGPKVGRTVTRPSPRRDQRLAGR